MKKILIALIIQFSFNNLIVASESSAQKNFLSNKSIQNLKRMLLLNFVNNIYTTSFTDAIKSKYLCPTNPLQLSILNQAIQLTGSTLVNTTTIQLSNQIGKQVANFTNQHRAANGLAPLRWDQTLANVGRHHTIAMADGIVPFDHRGFNSRFQRYISKTTGTVLDFAENIFYGSNIPTSNVARFAVDAWISSPGHNANLLGNFNRIGVSAFKNSQNVWYLTQLFALVQ